jgi:hypothetical protein
MHRRTLLAIALSLVAAFAWSESLGPSGSSLSSWSVDASASYLAPFSWQSGGTALRHNGFDGLAAVEYDLDGSFPFRFELGYIGVGRSTVTSSGELFRAWEGMRLALLAGYNFGSLSLGSLGTLSVQTLAGGALTAGDYSGTALALAYPSVVAEPRFALALRDLDDMGPTIAIPVELMFRSGDYSLAAGLSLGFSCRIRNY